jgi:gluconokinase
MKSLIVMGVAGCGKSSLGRALAAEMEVPLIEGDDFHLPGSVEKMRAGVPLDDADRQDWLDRLGQELLRHPAGAVLTCSALKRAYRDRLRLASPGARFAHLVIDRDTAWARVRARAGAHLFPAALVDSQFATLERPVGEPGVVEVDATQPTEQQVQQVLAWMEQQP